MATQTKAPGERLSAMLNPIKDLAKNWDVDVATYLEDYLVELAEVHITFDGGVTTMNFVEAAMLIQSSACVYSKKVDFLYNLVLQLLELMRCKKKLQKAKENRQEQAEDEDDDDQFLAQDSCAVDKNINMRTGDSHHVGRNLLPALPISFIPFDADERGNVNLYNQKNEILGNKRDYKINAWNVDSETGALLLDPAVLQTGFNLSVHSTTLIATPDLMRSCDNRALSDDDDPGGGGMMDDAPDLEPPLTVKESPPPKAHEICESPKKYSLRKRDKDLVSATEKARKLWQPLNPHEELPGAQAMRKGKTFVILKSDAARNHGKRKKGRPSTRPIVPINEFIKKQFYTLQCKLPKALEMLPLFEGLKPAILKEYKRRQAMLKAAHMEDEEQADEQLKFEDIFDDDHDVGNDMGFEGNDADDEVDFPPILAPSRKSFLDGAGDKLGYEDSIGTDQSFVNMMKEYANKCLMEARQHKHMSESAQRIGAWEDKLSSVLQEEEQHVPYDLHAYCTKIIEKFSPQPSKQSMDFSKIVRGETSPEVSRYFLAALQLANNYNVQLSCNDDAGGVHSVNKVELTLLSRRQHFEELDDFHAS